MQAQPHNLEQRSGLTAAVLFRVALVFANALGSYAVCYAVAVLFGVAFVNNTSHCISFWDVSSRSRYQHHENIRKETAI